jgi:hypothetical protein
MTFRKNIALQFGNAVKGYFYVDLREKNPIIFIGEESYKKIKGQLEDLVTTAIVHETVHLVFEKMELVRADVMYDGLYETHVWNIEGATVLDYLEEMSGLPKNLGIFRDE